MLPRYFIFFGVLALFAVIMSISALPVEVVEDPEDRANLAFKIVAKLIGSLFAGAALTCLTEATSQCSSHWKKPGAALSCGKDFLAVNKGRCAIEG